MGTLANLLADRAQGSLPSNTTKNPKEQANVITLRSGKELISNEERQKKIEAESETRMMRKKEEDLAQGKGEANGGVEEAGTNEPATSTEPKGSIPNPKLPSAKLEIPFPKRLMRANFEKQFGKFLDMLRKVQINIPLLDAILQIPSYTKFLKEAIANKDKLEAFQKVELNEECSAILLNKLPPKLKDPGSFSIPCTIGGNSFEKALCDLGASINLMPFSLIKKLGLPEPAPTTISLQLANRSIIYPRGIIEDVLVKVDKFILPADFVILDMDEDRELPLIFGRPFLATGRALIDVEQGELTLRVNGEQVTFSVFRSLKYPSDNTREVFRVDTVDALVHKHTNLTNELDAYNECISNSIVDAGWAVNDEQEEAVRFLKVKRETKKEAKGEG